MIYSPCALLNAIFGRLCPNSDVQSLSQLKQDIKKMDAQTQQALDDLRARVAREGDVAASATALVSGLAQQVRDLSGRVQSDPALVTALQELGNSIDSQSQALSAAVVAGTSTAPATGADTTGGGAAAGGATTGGGAANPPAGADTTGGGASGVTTGSGQPAGTPTNLQPGQPG